MNDQTQPLSNQNLCKHCLEPNRTGDLFCHYCGVSLLRRHDTISTRTQEIVKITKIVESEEESLPAQKPLVIQVMDEKTLVIQPKSEVVLGRSGVYGEHTHKVDIDLMAYDGFAKGVSKFHALIRRESDAVYLVDLGSKNGTSMNGTQISPHEPYRIQDGDLAYLGALPIRFNFPNQVSD